MTSVRHFIKILIFISVLLLLSCSSSSSVVLAQQDIYGSGVLAEETRTFAGGCTGVTFAVAGDLDIDNPVSTQLSLTLDNLDPRPR